MRHTFLLEEGNWKVAGHYTGLEGRKLEVEGSTDVQHGPDTWVSEGDLFVKSDEASKLHARYEIVPMIDGVEHTTWSCQDPNEGVIRGTIAVVEECVISSFRADATDYHGVDVLRRAKDNSYQSRGFAMRGATQLSSWALRVSRARKRK